MREVREQIWRAGKYAAVGIVFVGTLPVLIPSVFVLCVLLITILLPLACGVGGFWYLQKNATMWRRYLPGAVGRRSSGGDSSHHTRFPPSSQSGGFTLLELLHKDVDFIDTYEIVDEEFDSVVVSTAPTAEKEIAKEQFSGGGTRQQLESREEKNHTVQLRGGEKRSRTTSVDNLEDLQDGKEFRGGNEDTCAEGDPDENDRKDDEKLWSAEQTNFQNNEEAKESVDSSFEDGAVNSEKHESADKQFVGTVPENSGACNLDEHKEQESFKMACNFDGRTMSEPQSNVTGNRLLPTVTDRSDDTRFELNEEREKKHEGVPETCLRDNDEESSRAIPTCKSSSAGDQDGIELEEEKDKNLINDMDGDVYEIESGTVSELNVEDLTSKESCAVHPELRTIELSVSDLNSSGASRPESTPTAHISSELLRPEEPFSDHESFESTSDASFEAIHSEKEQDFQNEDDRHSLRSQSLRGVESFDGDDDERDDLSLLDEDNYHYEVHSEVPNGGNSVRAEIARPTSAVLHEEELSSMFSGSEEEVSGPPCTSQDSDSETTSTLKGSRSVLGFSEDNMYDSEEQWHLQQVHAEEEQQLSEELKAIKIVVGDQVSNDVLVNDIEELSQILGIELPPMSDDVTELEWAKVAVEVLKVVVGLD